MTFPATPPRHLLLIKSHSLGIGDVLRSSAAWQVLHNRWPGVQLHLVFLSRHPGYPTAGLIHHHPLLSSAHFVDITDRSPDQPGVQRLPMRQVLQAVWAQVGALPVDGVIDFEASGVRTSWLCWRLARRFKAVSVGIAQFPLRSLFYDHAAPSVARYMQKHGLQAPMDYTERDFVALAALGLKRAGQRIVLRVTPAGQAWQITHGLAQREGTPRLVLNIGCGTEGALPKRPDLPALAQALRALRQRWAFELHLSGAPFEQAVNQDFAAQWQHIQAQEGWTDAVHDWSGACSLDELTGLLAAADLVVSSDSGPYHMAVGLQVPTLCWFNFATPASVHSHADVVCLVLPNSELFTQSALGVLANFVPQDAPNRKKS
jgi:ADP-heptose:LPS heptosyltransferase